MNIKSLFLSALAGLISALVASAAITESTATYTNYMGDVVEVVTGVTGDGTATTFPAANEVIIGTAAPTATPSVMGQIAIDAGDAAYIAVGGTSSDWAPVPQFNVLNSSTLGANYNLTNRTPNCIGEFVYAKSNVLSAATGAGTTGTVAVAVGLTVNDWIIVK